MGNGKHSGPPDPKFLLEQLKSLESSKFRAASSLSSEDFAALCSELDEARGMIMEALGSISIPDFPEIWEQEGLKHPALEKAVGELRAKAPNIDPQILEQLRAYQAAMKEPQADVDAPKQTAFFSSRAWTDFGEPMIQAIPKRQTDSADFEMADWAYTSALPSSPTAKHAEANTPSSKDAWNKLIDLLAEPDDFQEPLHRSSRTAVANAPATSAVPLEPAKTPAIEWASWVQSMANSGMISAESIHASIPSLAPGSVPPTGAVPPPGSPPVESWTQWLDSSVKAKAPKADETKE